MASLRPLWLRVKSFPPTASLQASSTRLCHQPVRMRHEAMSKNTSARHPTCVRALSTCSCSLEAGHKGPGVWQGMASRPDTVVSGMRRCCSREPACQDRPAARLGVGLQWDAVCSDPNRERLVICDALTAAVIPLLHALLYSAWSLMGGREQASCTEEAVYPAIKCLGHLCEMWAFMQSSPCRETATAKDPFAWT